MGDSRKFSNGDGEDKILASGGIAMVDTVAISDEWGGRMNKVQWPSDAPTKAGFYWHRNGGEPRIVWVVKSLYSDSPDELEIYFPGQDYSHAPEECKGEWCGPILPQE